MNRSRSDDHTVNKKRNDRKQQRKWTAIGIGVLLVLLLFVMWQLVPESERPAKGTNASANGTPLPGITPSPRATASPAPSGTGDPAGAKPGPGNETGSPPPADSGERVTLTFVGDVIMAETVESAMKQHGYDYPFKQVKPYLERADVTIANLETPVTERGTKQDKEYAYQSTPKAMPAFKDSGIDIVNLANNHSLDMGVEGLIETFDHLAKHGIERFGAGRNRAEAYSPVIVEKKGIKIAFLGFTRVYPNSAWFAGEKTPGLASMYDFALPLAVEAIEAARKKADLVVVVAHWGVERQDLPEAYQRQAAKAYIDAGADLIVGGHPHVLQGFETYKDKWIVYSLGNFIFTTNDVAKTWETIILEASCTKERQCEVKAVPVLTKWAQPVPLEGEAGAALLQRLSSISYGAKVGADGQVKAAPGAPTPLIPPKPSAKPTSSSTPKPTAKPSPAATPKQPGKQSPAATPTPKQTPKSTPKPTQKAPASPAKASGSGSE
ncbi:CapA family protein [Paenibacillus sp. MBLB4367]|uniref:CapA family protein n=1 Tax=Paenibacillus sp. MBLB4367 TaxID=3384767 RepID=UPI003908251C